MITVGSLFSGIGGLELGLERTGAFKTIWQSEIDDYASAVLRKHWPDVPNLGDITKVKWEEIEKPDLICGGFPCQDISVAGKGIGIKEGTRSGLWKEYVKAIRILRPTYGVVENVSVISKRGLFIILGDITQIGYNAEWKVITEPLTNRKRLFVIIYNGNIGFRRGKWSKEEITTDLWRKIRETNFQRNIIERGILRTGNGVSCRVDRIKCLGNAVVPQVAQAIGEMILEGIE